MLPRDAFAMQRVAESEVSIPDGSSAQIASQNADRIVLLFGQSILSIGAGSWSYSTRPALDGLLIGTGNQQVLFTNALHGLLTQIPWYVYNNTGAVLTIKVVEIVLQKDKPEIVA